jgi:cysteine synthase B
MEDFSIRNDLYIKLNLSVWNQRGFMVLYLNETEVRTKLTHSIHEIALLKAVGNTPLLHLNKLKQNISNDIEVLGKAEWFNPSGSVKDRPALNIIQSAIFEGKLLPGMRLLDSTSGNMGIAYATFGALLDIPISLLIPKNASQERIAILEALGAEIILTDSLEGTDGAIKEARQLVEHKPNSYYYANQYDNPSNWQAHYKTTGPEIVEQTQGNITHFVAGLGTSGTIVGVSKYLKEFNPKIQVIAVQPESTLHGIEGLKYIPTALETKISSQLNPDETIEISTERAYEMVSCMAREEGYFVGVSSGAAAAAAIDVASNLKNGVVVTVFPDAGYKYLSETQLWQKTEDCKKEKKIGSQ